MVLVVPMASAMMVLGLMSSRHCDRRCGAEVRKELVDEIRAAAGERLDQDAGNGNPATRWLLLYGFGENAGYL